LQAEKLFWGKIATQKLRKESVLAKNFKCKISPINQISREKIHPKKFLHAKKIPIQKILGQKNFLGIKISFQKISGQKKLSLKNFFTKNCPC
jgi:hypothetical protein